MTKNPHWNRDELILALDLYFRINPLHSSGKHSEVVALSELLKTLPFHRDQSTSANFRSPNAVHMKLHNFLRLDPRYSGKGLDAGSKLDIVVWSEFASNRELLEKTAAAIRYNYPAVLVSLEAPPSSKSLDDDEFLEGKILTRLHKTRERNLAIARKKKKAILTETGGLICEVCSFDFVKVYGELGKGFAECHHLVPISEIKHERRVRLADLAIVCANCHRMLHRSRPMLSVEKLREIVRSKCSNSLL